MANEKNLNMFITVDDGSRRVPIHNIHGEEIGSFVFHPTDIGIVQRYNDMVGEFDAITQPLEALRGPEGGELDPESPEAAQALKEAEARLCAAVNRLLGSEGAAEAFFGSMHPFSPVGGAFYCEQVLGAVGAYIGDQFDTETAKFSDRAKKYLK